MYIKTRMDQICSALKSDLIDEERIQKLISEIRERCFSQDFQKLLKDQKSTFIEDIELKAIFDKNLNIKELQEKIFKLRGRITDLYQEMILNLNPAPIHREPNNNAYEYLTNEYVTNEIEKKTDEWSNFPKFISLIYEIVDCILHSKYSSALQERLLNLDSEI